jgi:pyruvate formate lyase activating enzyme
MLGQCQLCNKNSPLISKSLGVCLNCIREKPKSAIEITDLVHAESRRRYGLPSKPPHSLNGISCNMCANDCRISVGEKGFCGLVCNKEGKLIRMGGTPEKGILEWCYDPLPTNCVAEWFCPGCTGAGYPKQAYKATAEYGHSNLAVFYGSCSYDCLYCQNCRYRSLASRLEPSVTAESLAQEAGENVSCICFFGGDPSTQMPHALKTSEIALEKAKRENRILRICWETNGYELNEFALKGAEISLKSGGNLKFDLKTWDENLNSSLCGVSNKPTLAGFELIAERFFEKRRELPVLTASTLLVPGYIDVTEIQNIASFIAEMNATIPYTLLAFSPQYVMDDLPKTSRKQADKCCKAAKKYLKNVRVANVNLLS